MLLKNLLSIFFILIGINFTFSQEYCGTSALNESWISYYHKHIDEFSQDDGKFIYVPMRVSVLRNDDGSGEIPFLKLYQSIGKLNSDFEQVGVQFFLSEDFNKIDKTAWNDHADFNGGAQMMKANNVSYAINCYVVKNPAGNCGYYTPRNDGLALGTSCMGKGSSTWSHEMGHLLTLPHTFYGCEGISYRSDTKVEVFNNEIWGELEKVDGSNCRTAGDRFCDTEPDYISYRWSCNSNAKSNLLQTDLNGESFRSNGKLFMSYANDICQNLFSEEQIRAMRANITGNRTSLVRDTTPQTRQIDQKIIEMISPIENEAINYRDVNINWKKVEGATHYYIEVSRRKSFSGNHTSRSIISNNSYHIDELINNQNYYIRILPFNFSAFNENFSETIVFRTSDVTASNDFGDFSNDIVINTLINKGESLNVTEKGDNEIHSLSYSIHNLMGEMMIKDQLINKGKHYQLSTDRLNSGTYFIRFNLNSNKTITKKFIIQ